MAAGFLGTAIGDSLYANAESFILPFIFDGHSSGCNYASLQASGSEILMFRLHLLLGGVVDMRSTKIYTNNTSRAIRELLLLKAGSLRMKNAGTSFLNLTRITGHRLSRHRRTLSWGGDEFTGLFTVRIKHTSSTGHGRIHLVFTKDRPRWI
jgi:hypothetical protein